MPAATKETIYIDVEDEITSVIEKVATARHKIVALVLPKHTTVFQSVVNMKLLKKAAKSAQKNLVLITSDKAVLAIAGTTGLHVAKTLSSKPEIPTNVTAASTAESEDAMVEEAVSEDAKQDDDAIELDNTDGKTTEAATPKKSGKKLIKIPDFSKFSTRMAFGFGGLILLIVLWYVGFVVMPKAVVTVNTDIMTTAVNAQATARVGSDAIDLDASVLPAERAQVEKINNVTVPATGEKNVGQKATGLMNLTNCINDGEDKIVPAGTAFSAGSLTFVTTEAVTLDFAIFAGNNCLSDDFGRDKDVPVIASNAGPNYNVGAQSYTSSISGIRAFGSAMSGGTTEIVKVVSAEDIEKAKAQLNGVSKSASLTELKSTLEERGVRPIEETLREGEPKVVASPNVDAEASETTVTMTVTYSLIGVSDEDLNAFLDNEVQKSLGEAEKNIRDNGLNTISFTFVDAPSEADTRLTVETVAKLGPEINEEALKQQIAGKRRGEIENIIEDIEGVRSVSVEYSPAWITTTPKSADKIELIFNEQDGGR